MQLVEPLLRNDALHAPSEQARPLSEDARGGRSCATWWWRRRQRSLCSGRAWRRSWRRRAAGRRGGCGISRVLAVGDALAWICRKGPEAVQQELCTPAFVFLSTRPRLCDTRAPLPARP